MKKTILSAIAISSFIFADFNLSYILDEDGEMSVAYKDAQHVKITTKDKNEKGENSQLIVGNRHYMVMSVNGKKEYIDIDKANKELGELGNMMGMNMQESKPTFKILKKGAHKNIAGIDAQEWLVEINDNGQKSRMKVYVTDNKEFVDAIKELSNATKSFYQNGDNMFASFLELKDGYAIVETDGMKLKEFNTKSVDNSLFSLPNNLKPINHKSSKQTASSKALKACPIGGTGKKSTKLSAMLKENIDGWKLIENQSCINMMGMLVEGAVYKKGNEFTRLTLSVNVEGENGLIAKYKMNNMKMSDYKRGKINGFKYQMAHVGLANEYVLDIRLPNALLSLDSFTNKNLDKFAKELNLSKFKAVKKSSPQEQMQKSLQNIKIPKGQNTKELQDAMKQLQNMFGQ